VGRPPLFLLDDLPLDDVVLLGGEEGRHAAQAMRLRTGEPVLLSDGRGTLVSCTVHQPQRDGLLLRVDDRRTVPRPRPAFGVVQALPKGDRGELAVELMTELGVDEIVPWQAGRSVAQWRGPRAERSVQKWQRTAREAAKQSRRAHLPVITGLADTTDVCELLAGRLGLVLHEAASEPLASCPLPDADDVLVIVGPEGGIAEDELAAFQAAGAVPVRLGDPVLRTSTAGAAALAVLSVRLGRWGSSEPSGS
jgi:16S rRNA (uracil1498-N3)-methyltransferase